MRVARAGILYCFVWSGMAAMLAATNAGAQAKPSASKPATTGSNASAQTNKSPATAASDAVPSPQSKHYPILLIASGTEPFWSLKLGMKGPQELDRAGYPNIPLEPGDVDMQAAGANGSWIYHAKDTQTNADVTVHLTRETCSDKMSDTKYPFKAVVQHAQIGTLDGCARIAPDQFPEFKQKNLDDDDPDKVKPGPAPITKFKAPTAVAYLDAGGRVVLKRGEGAAKVVAPKGYQLSLSHDGKRLLFTRDDEGTNRTIVEYDATSGRAADLVNGAVQGAFWSPDDARIAFLKFDGANWHVWTMPAGSPDKAAQLAATNVLSLDGWADPHTVLAQDDAHLYWIGDDGATKQTLDLREVYGTDFLQSSGNTIRMHPLNSDLLLISAPGLEPKPGAATDPHSGMGGNLVLYEIKSKRRVVLNPEKLYALDGEWSRDGIQVYFTNRESAKSSVVDRLFWDGSGLRRYLPGSDLVIGQ